ncbi:uncharacterized protein [Branchiostoma lanceolatum]|uniref:uncharacterized protein isoform X2 n=1 Tax=Branchiostoma lanceolatum TaxID=7740 RepID=UPI0034523D27
MDRPGSSFNMGSSLPGQVNGGFDMTDGNEITVTSLSGSRIATRQTWEDGIEAFSDPDRMEKGLLLVGIGTALMTFNQHGPNIVGWVMVPAGVLHIVWSWYEFYIRLHWLRKGSDQALSYRRSLWWTGALVVLIVAASIVELYGNIMYGAFVVVTFPDGEGQGLPTTPTP